jgi:transposase
MPKGKSNKVVIKHYDQNQAYLLPPSLEEMIPADHFVRSFSKMMDQLDLDILLKTYRGGGASIFHPRMMLKILVYAYLNKIYSSRKIAKALREDIHFMWLSGMQQPDFRTINQFRSSRLKKVIDQVFASQVEFCLEQGFIKLENYYVDGTKIEANASKNSYVWGKNVSRYKDSTQEKIKNILQQIEQVNQKENRQYRDKDLEELGEGIQVSSKKIEEHVKKLKDALREKQENGSGHAGDKEVGKAIEEIEKKHLPKLQQYEQQQENLSGRNSYSKTDVDATFCRLKNGLLRPGYNAMIGTENQIIINYSIHQQPGESGLFIPHLKKLQELLGALPENVIGDAAFGSHENYDFLDRNNIGNYLKYNTFESEQSGTQSWSAFSRADFAYQPANDRFVCPGGRYLHFKEVERHQTDNGYINFLKVYECNDCNGCPFQGECTKMKGNKVLRYNPHLEHYRAQARNNLTSPKGVQLRKKRSIEPETVFGDIKWNQRFSRFHLRGLQNVNIEWGLLSLAHNFKKMYQIKPEKNQNASLSSFEFGFQNTTTNFIFFNSCFVC